MSRLRVTGRGVAIAASVAIHAGVVVALLPSLVGEAAPTPNETPMAIDMAGMGDVVSEATPTEAPPEPVQATEPTEVAQALPVEPEQLPVTEPPPVAEEPPTPAETPPAEMTEAQPPPPAPDDVPPDLVTTTAESDTQVASMPETVEAVAPEQPELVPPPPSKPEPPVQAVERQPPRRDPPRQRERTTRQPQATPPAAQTAALPSTQPATQPPASPPPASSGSANASYRGILSGHIRPYVARSMSEANGVTNTNVSAVLTFDGSGEIESVEIEPSSGSSRFDSVLKRAIRRSSPLPAPPAGVSERTARIPLRLDVGR